MAGWTARRVVAGVVVAVAVGALGGSVACGTDPVGVEACRRVEKVRCESARGCQINLERPVHNGDTAEDDVAACIRYYDDQCLHGIAGPKEPGPGAVDACVQAIIAGDCSVVRTPESHPACQFLVPPTAPPKADAAADAPSEASPAATPALDASPL